MEKERTGKWVGEIVEMSRENFDEVYRCSVCAYKPIQNHRTNFCPNCGIKMERPIESKSEAKASPVRELPPELQKAFDELFGSKK